MNRITKFAAAAIVAASGMTGQVLAADMIPVAPAVVPVGGWYLKGFVGISNQQLGNLDNALFHTGGTVQFLEEGSFDAAPLVGFGFGYAFNHWFRADVTGEYRAASDFSAFDRYDFNNDGIWDGTNDYSGRKSEALFLANAYFDLGTWSGITPYVGAGIGTSRNTITGFTDLNVPNAAIAYANSDSKWNLAWALYAGFGWAITDSLTVDLGYRYVDLGDAQSGDLFGFNGTNTIYNPMIFNDLTSHDVVLGVRYNFW